MRRLSSNAASAVVGGAVVAVLSAGTAVAVTTSNVSVTDPTTGARARVTSGGVVVNARDAVPAATTTLSAEGGTFGDTDQVMTAHLPKVPSSGRFEVQTVSLQIRVPAGQRPTVQLYYRSNGHGYSYYLPVIYQSTDPDTGATWTNSDVYAGAMDVHLYADPGTEITVYTDRHSVSTYGTGQYGMSVSVSGHTG